MSIRDLRARKTKALHAVFAVPAFYQADEQSEPVLCNVRVHLNNKAFGDMAGFDFQPAARLEEVPEIICLSAEVSPTRGGVFSIVAGEAFRVEVPNPPEGLTQKFQCTRLTEEQAEGLPVPPSAL
ncbi:MAG: hypothetical protein ABJI29_06335 [Alphaproteobacteria bacterium]|uniref:hypothetical protein n=1 Tax=Shimia sp. TaxID=1954381 RepID=UPI00329A3649